jgi:peptide deformylase
MFVMQGAHGRINLVNPVVVNQSIQPANLKEGCLSAPGDFIIVPSRVDWVHVKYQNELGQDRFATFGGIHSVAFFHELDHLDGKSFMQNKSIPRPIRNFLKRKWGVK